MTRSSDSFVDLMNRLARNDPEAARQLFAQYAERLIGLAYRHLDRRIRQKVDPEEVMQSALASFFERQRQGQFDLRDWNSLWSLLVTITLRKCGHKIEYYRAACRDVAREHEALSSDDSIQAFRSLTKEPTPSQAAMIVELTAQILESLKNPQERQIFTLALDGASSEQIADKVNLTRRTVQRVLARVREMLERMREQP